MSLSFVVQSEALTVLHSGGKIRPMVKALKTSYVITSGIFLVVVIFGYFAFCDYSTNKSSIEVTNL